MFGVCWRSQEDQEEVAVPPPPPAVPEEELKRKPEDGANAPVVQAANEEEEEESPWAKLSGEELESAIREGLVKCLDSKYLVERAKRGEPLVRLQDMPEEAYIGLDKLKEIGTYSKRFVEGGKQVLYQWLPLMIVSYAWLSPKHPDPFGETLGVLAEALKEMKLHGVIIDFTALPQVPRSDSDNETFKRGLPCLNRFYSHPHVIVLKVSQFPEGYPQSRSYELPQGYKPVEYNGRGWCFAEAAMAGLGKSPKLVCDVSRLSPDKHVVGGSVVLPRPPAPPQTFDTQLQAKTFTQPKTDTARVQGLYRTAFNERVQSAKSLQYSNVGWQPGDIVLLAAAIADNQLAETLELSGNDVGERGMEALGKVLRGHRKVMKLELPHCRLGPDGARELAEVLKVNTAIAELNLSDAIVATSTWQRLGNWAWGRSPGAAGAQYLAEALRVNSSLTTLYLEDNRIGDEGAQALAEALTVNTSLTTLYLDDSCIGDVGAQALAEVLKVNAALTRLSLWRNQIGDKGAQALAETLKVNAGFTMLGLRDNCIGDEGARALTQANQIHPRQPLIQ